MFYESTVVAVISKVGSHCMFSLPAVYGGEEEDEVPAPSLNEPEVISSDGKRDFQSNELQQYPSHTHCYILPPVMLFFLYHHFSHCHTTYKICDHVVFFTSL